MPDLVGAEYSLEIYYDQERQAVAPLSFSTPVGDYAKGDFFYLSPTRRFPIAEVRHAIRPLPGRILVSTALVLGKELTEDNTVAWLW